MNIDDSKITEKLRELLKKHPNMIPLIIKKHKKSQLISLKKEKYLVENLATVGTVITSIRQNLGLQSANSSIFLFVNETLIRPTDKIIDIYNKFYSETDYHLHIVYHDVESFG